MDVPGASGAEIFEFLANPDDESYRAWWPGTHLQPHSLAPARDDHVGDLVCMDEYIARDGCG